MKIITEEKVPVSAKYKDFPLWLTNIFRHYDNTEGFRLQVANRRKK